MCILFATIFQCSLDLKERLVVYLVDTTQIRVVPLHQTFSHAHFEICGNINYIAFNSDSWGVRMAPFTMKLRYIYIDRWITARTSQLLKPRLHRFCLAEFRFQFSCLAIFTNMTYKHKRTHHLPIMTINFK